MLQNAFSNTSRPLLSGARWVNPAWHEAGGRGKLSDMRNSAHAPAQRVDPACDVAHGRVSPPVRQRTLVAVFDSPVARFLLKFASDTGFAPVLVEPGLAGEPAETGGFTLARSLDGHAGAAADVVVTDHHRPELGPVLAQALAQHPRWVGVMGNPRHPAPHVPALAALGVPPADIARVHRPIGLNIGSRTPAEIALATLAGLIADRNDRPGGFVF